MGVYSFVSDFFRQGGPFMYIILATAVLIVAISIERILVISRASRLNGVRFLDDLLNHISAGKLDNADLLCKKVHSPASKVALAVINARDRRREMLIETGEAESTLALSPLAKRLGHLGMLANVATLLGLLGTIFGLITAFSSVGAADPSQRSAFLAAGISQALNTTAFGLIVAVPTLLIHSFLSGRLESIASGIDEISYRVADAMADSVHNAERPAQADPSLVPPAPPAGTEQQLDPAAQARLDRARDESVVVASR